MNHTTNKERDHVTRLAKAMSAFNFGRSGSADGRDARSFAGRGVSLRVDGSGAPPHRSLRWALGLAVACFAFLLSAPSAFADGQVEVEVIGSGDGMVTSTCESTSGGGTCTPAPAQIDCDKSAGPVCSAFFDFEFFGINEEGSATLTATPASGSTFVGWTESGATSSERCTTPPQGDPTCKLTLNGTPGPTSTVTAEFESESPGGAGSYVQGATTFCAAQGTAAGQCQALKSVAVDDSTGMVYAVDTGNNRVNQFEADGTFVRAWGWNVRADAPAAEFQVCTVGTGCQKGSSGANDGQIANTARGIAVDPGTNIVYVSGSNAKVSYHDGNTGVVLGALTGTSGAAPPAPEQFALSSGLAVDTSDPEQHYLWVAINLAVTNPQERTLIDKFEVAGAAGSPVPAYVCQITGTATDTSVDDSECPGGPSGPADGIKIGAAGSGNSQLGNNIAVDDDGNLSVAEAPTVDRQNISTFDKEGLFLTQFKPTGAGSDPRPAGVAALPNGNVLTPVGGASGLTGGNLIQAYDPGSPATPVTEFGAGIIGGSHGVAVGADETIYVADDSLGRIWTFVPAEEFTLDVTVDGDGDGVVVSDPEGIECDQDNQPECSAEFAAGPITLTATPDEPGSVFAGWTGTGAGSCDTDPECVVTLDEHKSITATFGVAQHTLAIGITGSGSGDVLCKVDGGTAEACDEDYEHGTEIELVPEADTGSEFGGFSGDCTGPTCELTMDEDKSVTATFSPEGAPDRTLTIVKAGNGNGSFQCDIDDSGFDTCPPFVSDGSNVKIQATPEAASSTFTEWSNGSGSATVCNDTTTDLCEFTINANSSVTGTFTLIQRTLTITKAGTGDGSFSCKLNGGTAGTCAASYPHGSNLELIATEAASSSFTGWSNGDGSAASCSGTGTCAFPITADSSVTGTFTLEQRTLTVTKAGNGAGSFQCDIDDAGFGTCPATVPHGAEVTIQASPDLDTSVFTEWSNGSGSATVCNDTTTDLCEFTINANSSVTGTISLAKRQLTVSKAGSGTGTVTSSPAAIDCGSGIACEAEFDHGTMVLLSGAPGTNSHDVVWTAGCDGVNGSNQCIVEMDGAKQVTATFLLASHQLNASTAGTGTGVITSSPAGIVCDTVCSAPFEFGTVVSLTATPAAGSAFAGWTGACTGMGACHVTITQARMVSAHFDALFVPPLPPETCETNPALCPKGGGDKQARQRIIKAFRSCRTNAQKTFRQANRRANQRLKGKAKARAKRAAAKQRNRTIKRCQTQRRNRLQRL